jgi:uncharacterized protein
MSALPEARIPMQVTRETSSNNLIRVFEPGRVRIGERWFTSDLIVSADRILGDWTLATPGRVTLDDLIPAIELKPELLIVGAGMAPCIPDVDLMAALALRGIGLEFMQTAAACRTYNVLVHEGRRVVAALVLLVAETC